MADKPEPVWEDLSNKEKEALNPEGCDLEKQIMWSSDGSCHDKPKNTAAAPVQQTTQSTPQVAITGDKYDWMVAAGIPAADHYYVDKIMAHESGWRSSVVNSIGCIGIGQACPEGVKSQLIAQCPNWRTDPVCQLKFYRGYAAQYGGWQASYNFKFCVGNCYSTRAKITVYKPASNKWW